MKRWRNKIAFWKDRDGNELTRKQFFKRWGEGLQAVTPLQQTSWQMWSTWIVIVGLIFGIIVISILSFKTMWWLLIVLIGGLFNSLVQLLSLWQKKKLLERFT